MIPPRWMLLLALPFACCRADEDRRPPEPVSRPAGLDVAIQNLGASSFRTREKAQQALLGLAESAHAAVLEACLRAASTNQDVEVQSRLEEVMLEVVDRKIINAPRGFLGIRLMRDSLLLNGKEVPAILASEVLPDTGAAKAGVASGDYIVACDGKPIPEDPTTLSFIEYVQSHPPGTKVVLDIMRANQRVVLPVVLGDRPPEARGYSTRPVESTEEYFEKWQARERQRLGLPAP